jgi:hypothetical protein
MWQDMLYICMVCYFVFRSVGIMDEVFFAEAEALSKLDSKYQ